MTPEQERLAFERISSSDQTLLLGAWDALAAIPHRRERVVTVLDEEGQTVGRLRREVAVSGSAGSRSYEILAEDSSGTFEQSFWSRFAPGDMVGEDTDWASLVLPDDPLFLSAQGPGFFRYSQSKDTLIDSTSVSVLRVAVKPETERQGIQSATVYMSDSSIVGVEVVISQQSMLFQEVSHIGILLRPDGSGQWIPERTFARSTVGLPFARSRTYSVSTRYAPMYGQGPDTSTDHAIDSGDI